MMGSKRNEQNGVFKLLALAAFVLPMIEPRGYTVTSFIINVLAVAALFSMILESHK